jgi:hypothetical protein
VSEEAFLKFASGQVRLSEKMQSTARIGAVAAGVVVSCGLLAANHIYWRGADLRTLLHPRRFWEDLLEATTALDDTEGPPLSIQSADGDQLKEALRRCVVRGAEQADLRAWQFWRTLPIDSRLLQQRVVARANDDIGRSLLLRLGFRVLGGLAPLLLLWLGPLMAMVLLAWAACELAGVGRWLAALLFPMLLACSLYFVLCLSLPYSAVGFYLLGLLMLVIFSAQALLGVGSRRRFALTVLATGLVWALAVLCRSSTLFLLPGFLLALTLGWARRRPAQVSRFAHAAAGLGLAVLLVAPYVLAKRPQHHEVWLGAWEGLGDFDWQKGHHWNDTYAIRFLRRNGQAPPRDQPVWALDNEAFFRERVIADVTNDPWWFLSILAPRTLATVAQTRLWTSWGRAGPPSERGINWYYSLAPTADWFGIGPWRLRIPIPLLIGLTVLLVALRWRDRAGDDLLLLLCVGLGALGLPVTYTTASGPETQGFVLIYLLGLGLVADRLRRHMRGREVATTAPLERITDQLEGRCSRPNTVADSPFAISYPR